MTAGQDRVPPHDLEAEQALLGAVLLAPGTLDEVAELVGADNFYRPSHQRIYAAFLDMRGMGLEIDAISVKNHLHAEGDIASIGGAGYLLELQDACVNTANSKSYAAIVREKAVFRQLIQVGVMLGSIGYDASITPDEAVSEATSMILGLSAAHATSALPVGTTLNDLIEQLKLGRQDFLYPSLMPWLHIEAGELVVIGAGSSVGKTAFALNLADEWADRVRVTYFEYEMTAAQLSARLISKYTGITKEEMDNGLLPEQLDAVRKAATRIAQKQLYIEMVTCGIGELMAKIRREAQRGSKVVFIDYLGLIPFKMTKGYNHAKAVGVEVTNRLKRLAGELNIVIVLLSQIGREGAKKYGFIPSKEDLRDSGEIEQDADKVIMLGREFSMEDDPNQHVKLRQDKGLDPFDADAKDFSLIGIGVRKYRNGPLSEKWVRFYGGEMKYTDLHPVVGFSGGGEATQGSLYDESA